MKSHDIITICITEKDRQKAKPFGNNCGCIIATALARRGFRKPLELVTHARINGVPYEHEYAGVTEVKADTDYRKVTLKRITNAKAKTL